VRWQVGGALAGGAGRLGASVPSRDVSAKSNWLTFVTSPHRCARSRLSWPAGRVYQKSIRACLVGLHLSRSSHRASLGSLSW